MKKVKWLIVDVILSGTCLAQSFSAGNLAKGAMPSNEIARIVRIERINSFLDEKYALDSNGAGVLGLKKSSLGKLCGEADSFAFCASTNDVAALVDALRELHGGECLQEIENKLGNPTFKFARSMEAADFSRGVCLKYYVARKDWEYVDERSDTYVALYLNVSNRLEKIITARPVVKILDTERGGDKGSTH